jgi:tripartite-type tricarboxylate transporter receptor subunit TctC
MNLHKKFAVFFVGFFTLISSAVANGPVEIVVPFGAGGLTDNLGRYASRVLIDHGIHNIVVNKPGAAGVIGVKYARDNTNPSGTILMLAGGPGLIAPFTLTPQPYDISKDFQPIALIASDIMTVSVPANSPYHTLGDLISAIKKNNNTMTWGHASDINRISGLMFLQKINGTATAVPFNGGQQALISLIGGHVDFTLSGIADVKSMADSGRVRILAVASDRRHGKLPSVPTFIEQGVDFQHGSFYAFYASKNTPSHLIAKFNDVVVSRMRNDADYEFLHQILVPNFLGPKELARWYDRQVKIWQPIIQANKPAN